MKFGDKIIIYCDERDQRSLSGTTSKSHDQYYSAQQESLYSTTCPYCNVKCIHDSKSYDAIGHEKYEYAAVAVCKNCGWWSFESDGCDSGGISYDFFFCEAILKAFDIDSCEIPAEKLIKYIAKNQNRLKDINPKKFEEIVGSVYSEYFGYKVEFCSYCRPDRGIDLIVVDYGAQKRIAIQVKRYKNPIELSEIHMFYGALVHNKFDKGIFVTSSKFRSGAIKTAGEFNKDTSVEIDLVDGLQFLDYIGILASKEPIINLNSCPHWRNKSGWLD